MRDEITTKMSLFFQSYFVVFRLNCFESFSAKHALVFIQAGHKFVVLLYAFLSLSLSVYLDYASKLQRGKQTREREREGCTKEKGTKYKSHGQLEESNKNPSQNNSRSVAEAFLEFSSHVPSVVTSRVSRLASLNDNIVFFSPISCKVASSQEREGGRGRSDFFPPLVATPEGERGNIYDGGGRAHF